MDCDALLLERPLASSCCRRACCRVGERLVLGDANVSTMGAGDLNAANRCAREMVYRCGFSAKLGPVSLMDQEEVYLGQGDRWGHPLL